MHGKAHRQLFGTRDKAEKPGELMQADLCGPFKPSFQKKEYLLVFKDSHTKFRYCYFIKEKSEVPSCLEKMIAHAKANNHVIKEMSDNGTEFDNDEFRKISEAKGITQRLTAPKTPQLTGQVERDFRTIVEMARTFRYSNPEIKFPDDIWAELVSTAIFVLNRTGK